MTEMRADKTLVDFCIANEHTVQDGSVDFIENQVNIQSLLQLLPCDGSLDDVPHFSSPPFNEGLEDRPVLVAKLCLSKEAPHNLSVYVPQLPRHVLQSSCQVCLQRSAVGDRDINLRLCDERLRDDFSL